MHPHVPYITPCLLICAGLTDQLTETAMHLPSRGHASPAVSTLLVAKVQAQAEHKPLGQPQLLDGTSSFSSHSWCSRQGLL